MTHRGAESPGREPSGRRLGPWALAALLAALLVALIVVALTWLNGWRSPGGAPAGDDSRARATMLAQTATKVVKVSSYDYRHIDQDARDGAAVTTGAFATAYARSMASQVKPRAAQLDQVVACVVQRSAIASTSRGGAEAVVLLFVQLSTQNKLTQGQPRLDVASIEATMTRRGGEWYISQLTTESG